MVSFTRPLHPSNLGRQQNNIHRVMVTGSPPSRGYFRAIVSGPTTDWLLHSINRTHTGLIIIVLCSALGSGLGERLEPCLHACMKAQYHGKCMTTHTEVFNTSPVTWPVLSHMSGRKNMEWCMQKHKIYRSGTPKINWFIDFNPF